LVDQVSCEFPARRFGRERNKRANQRLHGEKDIAAGHVRSLSSPPAPRVRLRRIGDAIFPKGKSPKRRSNSWNFVLNWASAGDAHSNMEQPAPSVRELTASCISKFEGLLAVQDKKRRASLETRLADFKLWADGVGALAKPGASLDSRLQGRANDLGLVNNILTMLASSLDYYASLAKTSASADGAILNLDSAIKNLALIGVAIRRTGKASRNRRADQTFNPDAHQDLREHLECLVFLRPTETGVADLDTPKLSDLQRRLIEANLRRRHKFLLAQKYSKVQQGAQTQSLTPTVPSSTNDSPVKEGAAVAGITQSVADLHLQNPAPNPHHKGKERAAPTISGFSRASTAEGSLQHGAATNKYAPGAAKTQITLIASDAEFPQAPSVPLGRTILKCPCCCQSLPVETFRDPQRWK